MCDHDKEIYRGENDGCLIYRGKDYIVVNKPPGLDAEHGFPELLKKQYGFYDIYCVHRLDLAAGGLLVYALSDKAAGVFSRYIEEKQLKKSYLVVCEGVPVEAEGEWTDLLFKDSRKQKMFPVKRMRKGVKEAKLAYQVIVSKALSGDSDKGLQSDRDESELYLKKPENLMEKPTCADKEEVKKLEEKREGGKQIALCRVELFTGRFHQIRVQFASRKHPLAGDGKYGSRLKVDELGLFCNELSFPEPGTGTMLTFTAQPDMAKTPFIWFSEKL